MLIRYSAKNFQSFRELAEVSFLLNRKVQKVGWESKTKSGLRLSTALAAIGPNSAGKTALLKPVVFAAWFISSSFHAKAESRIPIAPHFSTLDMPTELEFDAEDANGR